MYQNEGRSKVRRCGECRLLQLVWCYGVGRHELVTCLSAFLDVASQLPVPGQ